MASKTRIELRDWNLHFCALYFWCIEYVPLFSYHKFLACANLKGHEGVFPDCTVLAVKSLMEYAIIPTDYYTNTSGICSCDCRIYT